MQTAAKSTSEAAAWRIPWPGSNWTVRTQIAATRWKASTAASAGTASEMASEIATDGIVVAIVSRLALQRPSAPQAGRGSAGSR